MVHDRLSPYLAGNQKNPNTKHGFRPHLSTQDIFLQIKECVIDNHSATQQSAILALHVKRAFDNVSHEAVLKNLLDTNSG